MIRTNRCRYLPVAQAFHVQLNNGFLPRGHGKP
jgi:hypothetical protein